MSRAAGGIEDANVTRVLPWMTVDGLISEAYESAGNVDVSGRPPASEITSSRSVSAIRSRIAEDFITFVRSANSAL